MSWAAFVVGCVTFGAIKCIYVLIIAEKKRTLVQNGMIDYPPFCPKGDNPRSEWHDTFNKRLDAIGGNNERDAWLWLFWPITGAAWLCYISFAPIVRYINRVLDKRVETQIALFQEKTSVVAKTKTEIVQPEMGPHRTLPKTCPSCGAVCK